MKILTNQKYRIAGLTCWSDGKKDGNDLGGRGETVKNETHEVYRKDHECESKANCDHENRHQECLEGMQMRIRLHSSA